MKGEQTAREQEHEERNVRQCVALWRACGDSEHDIRAELNDRGYTTEQIARFMAPVSQPATEQIAGSPSDPIIVNVIRHLNEQIARLEMENERLRTELEVAKGGKSRRKYLKPTRN